MSKRCDGSASGGARENPAPFRPVQPSHELVSDMRPVLSTLARQALRAVAALRLRALPSVPVLFETAYPSLAE